MKRNIYKIVVFSIIVCMLLSLIGVVILFFTDDLSEHMIFSDVSEIEEIDGMEKISEQSEITVDGVHVQKEIKLKYSVGLGKIDVTVYVFDDTLSSLTKFEQLTGEKRKTQEGYTHKTILLKSKYTIYKENILVYAVTDFGYIKMRQFIKVLDTNLAVPVKFIGDEPVSFQ